MPQHVAGICWPLRGTVGHATVPGNMMCGDFPAREGDDARVQCALTAAGKYRNGAARAWCRTHQQYWGVKADLAALGATGVQRCARHAEPMGYVVNPALVDVSVYSRVAIGCANDGALHVSAVPAADGATALHGRYKAIAVACAGDDLFGNADIVQINLTPVIVWAWLSALRGAKQTGCVMCARCGHPHLDLDSFAAREHRRHTCGNCGHDGTHSTQAIVSNPIASLVGVYGASLSFYDLNVHNHPVLYHAG
ncbi:MAG: hypothetical protein H7335_09990 [Massilia sp.]|nr:hypothetical protein [Massilia sp.]